MSPGIREAFVKQCCTIKNEPGIREAFVKQEEHLAHPHTNCRIQDHPFNKSTYSTVLVATKEIILKNEHVEDKYHNGNTIRTKTCWRPQPERLTSSSMSTQRVQGDDKEATFLYNSLNKKGKTEGIGGFKTDTDHPNSDINMTEVGAASGAVKIEKDRDCDIVKKDQVSEANIKSAQNFCTSRSNR